MWQCSVTGQHCIWRVLAANPKTISGYICYYQSIWYVKPLYVGLFYALGSDVCLHVDKAEMN